MLPACSVAEPERLAERKKSGEDLHPATCSIQKLGSTHTEQLGNRRRVISVYLLEGHLRERESDGNVISAHVNKGLVLRFSAAMILFRRIMPDININTHGIDFSFVPLLRERGSFRARRGDSIAPNLICRFLVSADILKRRLVCSAVPRILA